MADTVTIRVVLNAEAAKKGLDDLRDEVEKLGGATKISAKDQERLGKEIDTTGSRVDRLDKFLARLTTRTRGFSILLQAAKIPVYLGAFKVAVPFVSALSAGIVALTGTLGPLTGALAAVPAGILAIVSMVGVLKMATSGIGDAVKVLGDPSAKAEEIAEAMGKLTPPAQKFAQQLAGLKPEMDKFKRTAQEALLPFLGNALNRMVTTFPLLRRGIFGIGVELGRTADRGAKMIASGPFQADMGRIFKTNEYAVRGIGDALISVVSALRHLLVGGGELTRTFTDWIRQAAAWLNRSAEINRQNGDMGRFFRKTVDVMRRWGHILRDLGVGLVNVFRLGTTLGNDMSGTIEVATARFRAWTESARGRGSIARWFIEARPIIWETARLIGHLFRGLREVSREGKSGVVPTLRSFYPLIDSIVALLKAVDAAKLVPAVVGLVTAFAKFTNVASFQPLIDGMFLASQILNSILDLMAAPVVGQFATALVGASLGMKALSIAAKLSGLSAFFATINPGRAGGLSGFVKGMRGTQEATHTFANASGIFLRRWAAGAKEAAQQAGSWMARGAGKIGKSGRKIRDTMRFMVDAGRAWVRQTARMVAANARLAASWALARAKAIAHTVATTAQAVATGIAAAAQWALTAAMAANPITLIVLAIMAVIGALTLLYFHFKPFRDLIDGFWQTIQKVWDAVSGFFVDIWHEIQNIDIMGFLDEIVEGVRKLPGRIAGAAVGVWDALDPRTSGREREAQRRRRAPHGRSAVPGVGVVTWTEPAPAGWNANAPVRRGRGDTASPRGAGGNLARTMATHAALMSPGQKVTNALYGAYAGSDHRKGRALDLQGPGLQGYARNLRAMGGYAEFHGSGGDRHLHAVYGDTATPRGGTAVMTDRRTGGDSFVVNGPLIGQVIAESEIDVARAVRRGINEFIRERNERR